jgi:hypothetical protein
MRKQESKEFKVAPKGEGTETETVTIMITAMDGNSGGELGIKLLQMFGPPLLGVIVAMESNDMTTLAVQAAGLFGKLSPAEFKAIRTQLFKGAQVQELGEFHDLDDSFIGERFSGHVGSLYALVAFALKVNFANFFEDLGVSKARMDALMSRGEKLKKAIA